MSNRTATAAPFTLADAADRFVRVFAVLMLSVFVAAMAYRHCYELAAVIGYVQQGWYVITGMVRGVWFAVAGVIG